MTLVNLKHVCIICWQHVYWQTKERLQNNLYIIFLHVVNVTYVVLEWVCQIWTKFSEAKLRHVGLNGLHDLHDLDINFCVLCKIRKYRGMFEVKSPEKYMQVPNGTRPVVGRSKHPLSACYIRRKCSMETSHKSEKGRVR